MTRRLCSAAALVAICAATALPASAQRILRTERVRFSPGTSEATMTSAPRQGRPVRYLVGVSAGQTLVAQSDDPTGASDCYVQVFAPGRPIRDRYAAPNDAGDRYSVQSWTGTLSRAGDYQVLLINTQRGGTCSVRIAVY